MQIIFTELFGEILIGGSIVINIIFVIMGWIPIMEKLEWRNTKWSGKDKLYAVIYLIDFIITVFVIGSWILISIGAVVVVQ